MNFKTLSKDDMKRVIEGKGSAGRVPMLMHFWTSPGVFGEKSEIVQHIMNRYPMDADYICTRFPDIFNAPEDDPGYRWLFYDKPSTNEKKAYDNNVCIEDWSNIDEIIENFPKATYKNLFPDNESSNEKYKLYWWWNCLFERHWSLRGMENALTDFYIYPGEVHKLYRAFTDFYKAVIKRAAKEGNADGIFTSDDIGTQTSPFFSLEIFREFFKPYYKELIDTAHQYGLHFWLHSCGNIKEYIPDLVDIGLDVIHPIQKYTMEEKEIAREFGDKICIWAGFDVQQTIPYKTAEDVRKEVRFMMDTYYRPDGRLMITAGNGITGDCPIESLEALYDESFKYGMQISGK